MKKCICDFWSITSNRSLKVETCVVCGCEVGDNERETSLLLDD
jgi:hypothetical protein